MSNPEKIPAAAAPDTETGEASAASTCSASSRIEAMKAAQRFHTLANHPHLQAEAVADHYSKLASMAMDLRKMVNIRRHAGGCPELDRCIESLVKAFAAHHRSDFGIELFWQNVIADPRPTLNPDTK